MTQDFNYNLETEIRQLQTQSNAEKAILAANVSALENDLDALGKDRDDV